MGKSLTTAVSWIEKKLYCYMHAEAAMFSLGRLLRFLGGIILLTRGCYSSDHPFVLGEMETIRSVLLSDQRLLIGTSNAIYRLDPDTNPFEVRDEYPLSTPNRLLLATIDGPFHGKLLSCDNDLCFLANINNFTNMSWSVPRGMVFNSGMDNIVGIFIPNPIPSVNLTLLFAESANTNFGRRFVKGNIGNVNLMGPDPFENSNYSMTAERAELDFNEVFRYHLRLFYNGFIYYVTDNVDGENTPLPAGRVVRFCDDESENRGSFGSYFEIRLGCDVDTVITAATFIESAPFSQPTILITSRSESSNDVHMCGYSLANIDRLMQEKYDACSRGEGLVAFDRNALEEILRMCSEPGLGSSVSL